jgi:hypothetical protein
LAIDPKEYKSINKPNTCPGPIDNTKAMESGSALTMDEKIKKM